MKTIEDLTDAEILCLSDEEIDHYIDLACAEAGVPLMPPDPGPKPPMPTIEGDVEVLTLPPVSFSATRRAAVETLLAEINSQPRVEKSYAPGGSYRHCVADESSTPVVAQSERWFSRAHWDASRVEITRVEASREKHDRDVAEYTKIAERRAQETAWIRQRVSEVHEEARTCALARAEFARYLQLADGDETIARRFFERAHPERVRHLPAPEAE